MARSRRGSDRLAEIRRIGRRVQGGSWVLVSSARPGLTGRLIVALGRKAGPAVVRSRIRRIARECYHLRAPGLAGDVLLMARSDVSRMPRRQVRTELHRLFRRLEPTGSNNTPE